MLFAGSTYMPVILKKPLWGAALAGMGCWAKRKNKISKATNGVATEATTESPRLFLNGLNMICSFQQFRQSYLLFLEGFIKRGKNLPALVNPSI